MVDATDHKKNHKSGGGILSWIKSLTASPQPKKTTKKKSPQKRRPRKGNYKKKNANSSKSRPNRKPSSSKNTRRSSSTKSTGGLQSLQIENQKLTLEQKICEKKLHQENLG